MADLDVVIVNYNAGDFLQRCIATVLAACGDVRVAVVVVDNNSSDESSRGVKDAFPEVTVIDNEDNRGFARAANQGIAWGTAPFVLVLNPDSEVREGSLGDLVALGVQRPRAAVIGVLTTEPDGSVYPSARCIPGVGVAVGHALLGPIAPGNRFTKAYTLGGWDRRSERSVDWVSGSCMLLRRTAIEQMGAFDPGYFMYAEDADLCTRMRHGGWDVLFSPIVTVMHEGGVSTAGSRRMVFEHSRSIERYLRTWILTDWKRLLMPLARAVLWARAAMVARGATAP